MRTVLYSGRYGNMSSHTSTVALAIMATVSRLLPRNAKIKAAAKPSAALMALPVAVRIAGKVMAGTVIDMLEKPELIEEAKKELRRRVGAEGYIPPIPEGIRPMAINPKK